MTDFLNLTSNQRVDLPDLSFACFDSQFAAQRLLPDQFMTATAAQRMYVVSGFGATNPSAMLVTVTRGVALLGYRSGAQISYGAIVAEGDATKTLDMSTLSAGTYTLYIGLQYTPTATASRAVWNSAASTEGSVSQPTRQSTNWVLRAELASPGAEYLPIATAVVSGGTVTLTDQRAFFFEGSTPSVFAQTWGTGANDRSTDRANNGLKDLRTFVDAMRTCLEDIKGPGLVRWYSPMVGGQTIGFSGTTPTLGRTAWTDVNFYAQGSTTAPSIGWASNASMTFTRATNIFSWAASGGTSSWAAATGWGTNKATSASGDKSGFTSVAGSQGTSFFGYANAANIGSNTLTGTLIQGTDTVGLLTNTSNVSVWITSAGLIGLNNVLTPSTQLHVRGSGITFDASSTAAQYVLAPSTSGGSDSGPSVSFRDVATGANILRYSRGTNKVDFAGTSGLQVPQANYPVQLISNQTIKAHANLVASNVRVGSVVGGTNGGTPNTGAAPTYWYTGQGGGPDVRIGYYSSGQYLTVWYPISVPYAATVISAYVTLQAFQYTGPTTFQTINGTVTLNLSSIPAVASVATATQSAWNGSALTLTATLSTPRTYDVSAANDQYYIGVAYQGTGFDPSVTSSSPYYFFISDVGITMSVPALSLCTVA